MKQIPESKKYRIWRTLRKSKEMKADKLPLKLKDIQGIYNYTENSEVIKSVNSFEELKP